MLENVTVQIKLDEFDILREESGQHRTLKKLLGACCEVDYSKYNETKETEDIVVSVNSNKLSDVLKKYATIELSKDDVAAIGSRKDASLMFAKVEYK